MNVTLVPTQGCYQRELSAELVRETPVLIYVRVKGERYARPYYKATGLPFRKAERKFPCYRATFPGTGGVSS